MDEKIGERLRKYRKKCGLTQQQIADALNIDRTTYTCYEIGKTEPNIETISKLKELFRVSFIDLLTDSDNNDKVADILSNEPDNGPKVNDLSKFEQDFICKLRLMTLNERIELMYEVSQRAENSENNKRL